MAATLSRAPVAPLHDEPLHNKPGRAIYALYGLALGLVPLLAHLFLSSLGYNPTDDGFILAYSRRILDGQVPHRDFISIRPVGSPLLHAPFVLFGGEYTFWLDRLFVWCEFAVIAWAWVAIATRCARISANLGERFVLYVIAFVFSTHIFPIMAWHTVDGILLSSLGILLCLRRSTSSRLAGYALIGAAYLCKQNFLVMSPACLFLLGDWRRLRCWAATAVPGLLYAAYLLLTGALPDAIVQLGSQSDLVSAGITRYTANPDVMIGLLAGCALGLATVPSVARISRTALYQLDEVTRLLGAIAAAGVLVYCALALGRGGTIAGDNYVDHASFVLLGAVAGATLCAVMARRGLSGPARLGALAVVTAWSASISIGYNNPALAGGPLAVTLLVYVRPPSPSVATAATRLSRKAGAMLLGTVLVLSIVKYDVARHEHIYLEQPAARLTYGLDSVFPGGRLLKTNANTYHFLRDLDGAIGKAGGRPYAILPECPGCWVKAAQPNPLSIDWPQSIELSKPALVRRVTGDLQAQRGKLVVIVQRVSAYLLATGYVPLRGQDLAVVSYVRAHFRPIAHTRFFDLYA